MRLVLGFALSLAMAGASVAQPAGPSPNPAKLALARRIIEASGGAAQVDRVMKAVMNGVIAHIPNTQNSPDQQRIAAATLDEFRRQFATVTPKLLDISAETYADQLSEQELRDYLAFLQSPSGRGITEKLPVIQQQSASRELPLIFGMMPAVMNRVVDRVCQEKPCTAAERTQLQAALQRATPRSPR